MKLALKIFASIFALVIVALLAFVMTFDVNQYKDTLVTIVQDKTNRTFSIEGDLHLEPSLIPTVAVEGVKFGNAKWASQPDMVSVGKFEAQVALLPLLSKTIEVKRLILNDAHILLEKNKKGEANWSIGVADAAEAIAEEKQEVPKAAVQLPGLDISEVSVRNSTLTYIDAKTGTTEKVALNKLDLAASGFNQPLEIAMDASYNDIPVSMSGSGGSLQSVLNNEPYEVALASKVGKIKAEVSGKINDLKQVKGIDLNLGLNMGNLQDLAVLLKQELPDAGPIDIKANVADKGAGYELKSLVAAIDKLALKANGEIASPSAMKGIKLNIDISVAKLSDLNKLAGSKLPDMGPFSLSGVATDSEGGYKLSDFKLNFDKTDLNGEASIRLSGARPALTATTSSVLVDLTPFLSDTDEKKSAKKSKVFSSEPLPLDVLKKADVVANVTARKIQHPTLALENIALKLQLNNGKLDINPLRFNSGAASGTINVGLDASSNQSARLLTRIDISNFDPASLPTLQGKIDGGKTDVKIDISGKGNSVAAIMASLNGNFLVQMAEGTLKSGKSDHEDTSLLINMINSVYGTSKHDGDTFLKCGVINADIKDGIATLDKGVAFQTSAMNLIGSGAINLQTEELDIGIDPEARKGMGLSLGQLAELVRIRGTLAEPKAGPSTREALKSAATIGAAVATGGISILAQGLFDRVTADADPCASALGKMRGTPLQDQTVTAPGTTETKAAEKKTGGSLGDKIKGLFN